MKYTKQIHKCPQCGFKTALGPRYDKVGKRLVKTGYGRYCQHIDCDWSNPEDELDVNRKPIPRTPSQQVTWRGRGN